MNYFADKYSYLENKQKDYEAVAGPDWPSFEDFFTHKDIPSFVYKEIDEMLPQRKPFEHPTFCVNAFYSKEIPNNVECSLMSSNKDITRIRQDMLAGIRPPECNVCWRVEDNCQISDRQIKNQTLDYWTNIDIAKLFNAAKEGQNSEIMYKIDTSNACNGMCVTCGSVNSSSWAKLEKQHNIIPSRQWSLPQEEVNIDYHNAKVIGFRGGEPLLSQTNFQILEKLIEVGNTECFINFTTNTAVRLTERQKNIVKHFKNISMCFSIDGTGTVFEYMRYPFKWQECLDNLAWNRDNDIHVSVSFTLSNLNIFYYNETVAWFNQQDLPWMLNLVYVPAHFQPTALPEDAKKYVVEKNCAPEIIHMLDNHTSADDDNWKKAVHEIKKQDKLKNISIATYMPEVAHYVK